MVVRLVLVVYPHVERDEEQTIVLLNDPTRRWKLRANCVEDAVSRALLEGMRVGGE